MKIIEKITCYWNIPTYRAFAWGLVFGLNIYGFLVNQLPILISFLQQLTLNP